jgi:hypothetical protein
MKIRNRIDLQSPQRALSVSRLQSQSSPSELKVPCAYVYDPSPHRRCESASVPFSMPNVQRPAASGLSLSPLSLSPTDPPARSRTTLFSTTTSLPMTFSLHLRNAQLLCACVVVEVHHLVRLRCPQYASNHRRLGQGATLAQSCMTTEGTHDCGSTFLAKNETW